MSNIKKISFEKYKEIISLYSNWKNLNKSIKNEYSRGISSEDAYTNDKKFKVQIKGSSNFDSDLTSFGPTSEFDILEFARLNQENDKLYLYKIPIDDLYNIKVNSNETFKEQQQNGRRPRFSIIEKYIKKYNLRHYAIVDMITGSIS